MKRSRALAFATFLTLVMTGVVPTANAAAPPATKVTAQAQTPMVKGFIVQAEGGFILNTPKFPISGRFAATKLTWSRGLGGFGRSLELAEPVSVATASKMMAELKTSLGTDAIYLDREYHLLETDTQTGAGWGIDRIDQRSLPLTGSYTYGSSGAGVDVYVMDTGIRASHNDFGGRVKAGWTSYPGDSATLDCHGHGTHVAGTVAGATFGVAKAATLIPLKVFSCAGEGAYTSHMVAAMNWVTNRLEPGTPAVLNMSLGGYGDDTVLNGAIRSLVAEGVTVVVASGNAGDDACLYSPAKEPSAITVNASTSLDDDASYSNYGACTDIYAPGSNVLSASHLDNGGSARMSGTSMASPHVAGAAARILSENPGYSPAEVWAALSANATPITWYYTASDAKSLLFLEPASVDPGPVLTDIPLASTPTITGIPSVGETLISNAGSWTAGTILEYRWLRGASEISGATGSSYTLVSADVNARISVKVTGRLAGHLATVRQSAQTAIVLASFSSAPTPTITGNATLGTTLKVVTGSWSPQPKFGYQWLRNGVAIRSATKSSYRLAAADVGSNISVRVTATASGYTTTIRESLRTTAVQTRSTRR